MAVTGELTLNRQALAELLVSAETRLGLPLTDTAPEEVEAADLVLPGVLAHQLGLPPPHMLWVAEVAEVALALLAILLFHGRHLEVGMVQLANKFHICSFNPEKHEIAVYFRDHRTVAPVLIRLPVVDGLYPEGQDLENYILSFQPIVPQEEPRVDARNAEYIAGLVKEPTKLPSKVINAKKAAIHKRTMMLYGSDWTQLPDAQETLDEEEKIRWKRYRQDLRDITKQPGWPLDVVWPKQPFLFEVTMYE